MDLHTSRFENQRDFCNQCATNNILAPYLEQILFGILLCPGAMISQEYWDRLIFNMKRLFQKFQIINFKNFHSANTIQNINVSNRINESVQLFKSAGLKKYNTLYAYNPR